MLRISKKERQQLYNMNASVRRKIKHLKNTFNIDTHFNITTPKQFLTRREVNQYKWEAQNFLKNEHQYVKLGVMRGSRYHFYVTKEEYKELRKDIEKQQRYARQIMKKAMNTRLTEGGQKTAMSSGGYINQIRPTIIRQGLRSPYQQMYPIRFQKASIHSRKQFEKFKHAVKTFHTKEAYEKINSQAKNNYISALLNNFGSFAYPIADIIEQMTGKEFQNFYESDVFVDFDYIYSYEQADIALKRIAKGLSAWLENKNNRIAERNTTKENIAFMEDYQQLLEIPYTDSSLILSEWTPHTITFTYQGVTYTGNFRTKEIDQILRGNITETILNKAKKITR